MGKLEMLLDGQVINRFPGPPYVLGSEEYEADNAIRPGEHQLFIRAEDRDGWSEQTFTVRGAE